MKSPRKRLLKYLTQRRPIDALHHVAETLQIDAVRLRLPPSSGLYRAGVAEGVEVPMDGIIMPRMAQQRAWHAEDMAFILEHAPKGPCVLLDMGANVGLVTRQLAHAMPALAAAVCWEPHPLNFRLLVSNLSHLPHCRCVPEALGTSDGVLPFYLDSVNAGNYSLVPDSVREADQRSIQVPCRRISEALIDAQLSPAERALPLIWKTDVQGLDEMLATLMPDSFWPRVHLGVMEITRIKRPAFDRDRLAAVLETFPIRRFGNALAHNLTIREILEFAEGDDLAYKDLLFARA
jgi:FkbM family methyltransferase